jgi:hypothetical protein
MESEQMKMNGATFNRSSVLSMPLDEFMERMLDSGVYARFGGKRTAMFLEVWNIIHSKKESYKAVKKPEIMPKAIKVIKKKK